MSRTKREGFARHVEALDHLPEGAAYQTARGLYREGHSLREVAGQLQIASRSAGLMLDRLDQERRPWWCREVFRDAEGRHLDLAAFAARVKQLRRDRGLSQRRLAGMCGLCQQAISQWERRKRGPNWATLLKVVRCLGLNLEFFGVTWGPVPTPDPGPVTHTAAQGETTLTTYPYDSHAFEPNEPEPSTPGGLAYTYDGDRLADIVDAVTPSWVNMTYDTGPVPPAPATGPAFLAEPVPVVYRDGGAVVTFPYDPSGPDSPRDLPPA
jgi:transcriptional regulator with XRE-family HTH domain